MKRMSTSRVRSALYATGLLTIARVVGYARDVVVTGRFGVEDSVAAYITVLGFHGTTSLVLADAIMIWSAQSRLRGRSANRVLRTAWISAAIFSVLVAAAAPRVSSLLVGNQPVAAEVTRALRAMSAGFGGLIVIAAVQGQLNAVGRVAMSIGLTSTWSFLALVGAAVLSTPRVAIYWSWTVAVVIVACASGWRGGRFELSSQPGEGSLLQSRSQRSGLSWVTLVALASILNQASFVLERRWAVNLGETEVTAIGLGYKVAVAPMTVMVGVVGMLAISRLDPKLPVSVIRSRLFRTSGLMLAVLVPSLAVLGLLAAQIIALMFGRGQFTESALQQTAQALQAFIPAVIGSALYVIAVRANQAVGQLRLPIVAAATGLAVNYALLVTGFGSSVSRIALATGVGNLSAAAVALVPWFRSLRDEDDATQP